MKESEERAFEALIGLARTRLGPEDEKRVRRAVDEGIDWPSFLEAAVYHGLLPTVGPHLSELEGLPVPEDVDGFVQERTRAQGFKSRFLVNELCRVVAHLESRGIPVIAIKGPTLAGTAYGSTLRRQFGDLDLILSPNVLKRLDDALGEIDYELHASRASRSLWFRKWKIFIGAQVPYVRGNQFFHLDIHTYVMPLHFRHRIGLERLSRRAGVVDVDGCRLRVPDPEIMLQILCFHGQKNRWETLKYVCDINELVSAYDGLDWRATVEEASAGGGLKILLLGLLLARRILSTAVPAELEQLITEHPDLADMADAIIERLPEQHRIGTAALRDRMVLHYSMQDTLRAKAQYVGVAFLQRIVIGKRGSQDD